MSNNRPNQRASLWQKAWLLLSLAGLFLFGVAAEQPAESDCCQGTECGISLYPNRIEDLAFGETTYVSVQFICDGEAHDADIRVFSGWGLETDLSDTSLKVSVLELSSMTEEDKQRIVQNYIVSRAKPGADMLDMMNRLEYSGSPYSLDQICHQSTTAVVIRATYRDTKGQRQDVVAFLPVALDNEAVMDEFLKDLPAGD